MVSTQTMDCNGYTAHISTFFFFTKQRGTTFFAIIKKIPFETIFAAKTFIATMLPSLSHTFKYEGLKNVWPYNQKGDKEGKYGLSPSNANLHIVWGHHYISGLHLHPRLKHGVHWAGGGL